MGEVDTFPWVLMEARNAGDAGNWAPKVAALVGLVLNAHPPNLFEIKKSSLKMQQLGHWTSSESIILFTFFSINW